ncbi:MAG: UDP-3-O-(3-hydroxymyristoyl)glucosamine N-acyltransferase [Pseudomonadota bacterium]
MGDEVRRTEKSGLLEPLSSDKMFNLSELLSKLGVSYQQIDKKKDDAFKFIRTPMNSDEHSLIFVNKPDETTFDLLFHSRCSVVILEQKWGIEHLNKIRNVEASIFLVENPRLVVAQIIKLLYPDDEQYFRRVDPTAYIHPDAKIPSSAFIGPYCKIGNCQVGENSQVHSFSIIKDNVKIGNNVIIREFCLVGGCGFGFVRHDDGHLERIPHIGTVVIEDDVELFPYVNVDRGTLGETRIKKGTKIDHYAHIGHNSTIGEHCIITAGTVFCGGSRIGNQSWVGVGSVLKEKISVGDNVTIGLGSVVVGDIENNAVVAGNPAKLIRMQG